MVLILWVSPVWRGQERVLGKYATSGLSTELKAWVSKAGAVSACPTASGSVCSKPNASSFLQFALTSLVPSTTSRSSRAGRLGSPESPLTAPSHSP